MTVALVARDLMIASRVAAAAEQARVPFVRVDDPSALPSAASVRLLLVDWADRAPEWGARIAEWCVGAQESTAPRVILFGPHVDLEAHAAARASGLGPMWARSKLLAELSSLVAG